MKRVLDGYSFSIPNVYPKLYRSWHAKASNAIYSLDASYARLVPKAQTERLETHLLEARQEEDI